MNFLAPVENLKGIGPKTALILNKAGIFTVRDFFYNLPRNYEDYQVVTAISEVRPGRVVVRGKVENLTIRHAHRRNFSIIEGSITDGTSSIRVVWFNQNFRMKQFEEGKDYFFSGIYGLKNNRFELSSPTVASIASIGQGNGPVPIYVAHGGLKSQDFQRLVGASRDKFVEIPDLIPTVKRGTRRESLFAVHFPTSVKNAESARRYLAYEELFELILASKLNRLENEKLKSAPIPFDAEKIRTFVASLPFKLTNVQRKAAWEIFQDMERSTPMNRLLQGDVGSGKTIVAALAALGATRGGAQVAFIAPTAILASQHYEGLKPLLGGLGVKIALLTGATKQKPALKQKIASGEVNVVIGTHALLTDDTLFQNLGLVIIDEQHRFGVEQRQKLVLKSPEGLAPHFLAMTATPIPRSLQLTIFGDLDVSILSELPQGRKPIKTQILREIDLRSELYPQIVTSVKAGRQIYWICKAIEDGTKPLSAQSTSDVTSVKTRARRLQALFPKLKIAILHGRMKPAEKDDVMERFSRGEIDILVSTTVVEVGVNVPNATLIVIENAEGYGLAQLHQLRGRVGRGSEASYCYLLTPGDNPPSRRLRELEKSTDGFHLAEVDLKIRGPGEIYGSLQHGALDLRIASLSDTKLIARARADVEKFLQLGEKKVQYKELMSSIVRYQQLTTLN